MTENSLGSSQLQQRLSNFINFVYYNDIPSQQVWQHQKILHLQDFIHRIQKYFGYSVSVDEMSAFRSLSDSDPPVVTKDMFFEFGIWINRRQTARSRKTKNKSILQSKRMSEKVSSQGSLKNTNFIPYEGRRKKAEKELENQIIQNTLDKKWQYLTKVSQMNNWLLSSGCEQKSLATSKVQEKQFEKLATLYKVKDTGDQILILDECEEIVPLKVFDLKYETQKKKHIHGEKKKNNMKGTVMMVIDDKENFNKAKLSEKICERDQQLNYVLLEIIKMKDTLWLQNQVLTQCEVNR